MFRNFINKIKRQFQNNYIIYFILTLFLIFGVILGSFILLKYGEGKVFRIVSYFNWVFKYLDLELASWVDTFKFSFFANIKIILFVWILGFFAFGKFITPIVIFFQGISIGYTVAFLVNYFAIRGFLFSFLGLLPYYLFAIPTMLLIGSLSIFNSILKSKFRKNNTLRTKQFLDYGFILLFAIVLIISNSFIEGFFSFNLIKMMKILF